jgi:hypothetical protein
MIGKVCGNLGQFLSATTRCPGRRVGHARREENEDDDFLLDALLRSGIPGWLRVANLMGRTRGLCGQVTLLFSFFSVFFFFFFFLFSFSCPFEL